MKIQKLTKNKAFHVINIVLLWDVVVQLGGICIVENIICSQTS